MSNAEELFLKLESMPLQDLMRLCALMIDEKMEKRRMETVFLLLETRLQKYRIISTLGMQEST